jgi:hypothetical protein
VTRPRFHGLVILAAILAVSLAATPASAGIANGPHLYDAVDEVQSGPSERQITITGIIAGQTTATTMTYTLRVNSSSSAATEDVTARCDRFALLAMAKPGKYQFATVQPFGSTYDCKLLVRTP